VNGSFSSVVGNIATSSLTKIFEKIAQPQASLYRTLQSLVVTLCTATFENEKSTLCPQCVYVFCMDLRTAIITLYNINWLVFI